MAREAPGFRAMTSVKSGPEALESGNPVSSCDTMPGAPGLRERLLNVGGEVVDMLDADGEADEAGSDSTGGLLLFGEL